MTPLAVQRRHQPRACCRSVEDAGLNASAPPQQLWLDGWLVRYSPGKAKRARCVNAVARAACRWPTSWRVRPRCFREAGLPLVVRITPFSQPAGWTMRWPAHGLQRFDDTLVLAADLAAMDLNAAWLPAGLPFRARIRPTTMRIVGALRGIAAGAAAAHAERLAGVARALPRLGAAARRRGAGLRPVARAKAGLVGLYDIFTAPAARNQGLSRALCAALLRQAAARRCTHRLPAGRRRQ
jgi:GNAT superfamily N-acetyltransferase